MEELIPGVEFGEDDLNLDKQGNEEDGLGNFKAFKLSKIDKIYISNLNKDIEPFLYTFKLMSKLMRSCQILNEDKPPYSSSPFKMDNEKPLGYVPIGDVMALIQPNESVLKVLFKIRCSNKPLRNELGKLFGHLLWEDERSIGFCKSLIVVLNEAEFMEVQYYE